MTRHYYKSDVLQAVTAALLFHEDIALAARDERGGQLHPGAGNTVLMSDQAADLLREAWKFIEDQDQGDALREEQGHGYARYDLRAALPDRRTPQERTRDQVYSSGNRWQIENYEATH